MKHQTHLIPIGLVLVVERRTCQTCGASYDCPSSQLSELAVSPVGSPYQSATTHTAEGDSTNRSLRVVERAILHCQNCWDVTIDWEDLKGIRPPPKKFQPLPKEDIEAFLKRVELEYQERLEAASKPKRKKPVKAFQDDEL